MVRVNAVIYDVKRFSRLHKTDEVFGTHMNRKSINLALQGGGAYGAFTWGVLDHIIEDGRLDIEGVTGASSGAINAIMLTDGFARGGPD